MAEPRWNGQVDDPDPRDRDLFRLGGVPDHGHRGLAAGFAASVIAHSGGYDCANYI